MECIFGVPIILQLDNGKEFIADLISKLIAFWPGVYIINGCPRHPQLQGMVKRANGILQVKLRKWMEDNQTSKSPYSLVFGQEPVQHFSILKDLYYKNIIDEEELPDNFFEDS
ncbi:18993_t:CDS:2, partial [Racocetra persica]